MEEYKHIQELREMRSGFIMDWLRIMIPVAAGFDGLFSYIGNVSDFSYSWVLPLLGSLILVISLITWRVAVHYIDRQIVDQYPRMLEIEQQMQPQWHTEAIYYFENLKQQARHFLLEHILELSRDNARILNYQQYKEICYSKGHDPHRLLLKVWDCFLGRHSVISRGHKIQDVAVKLICIVTFSIAGILAWGINKEDCQFGVYLGIGLSAVLAVIFAFIAARWLVNR